MFIICLYTSYSECYSVQPETGRWQHVPNAPTNTVAPMPMASVDPMRTSFAGAAASQPQLTNASAASPLLNPLAGSLLQNQFPSLSAVGSLLTGPNLNSASQLGANAGGLGGVYPGPGPGSSNTHDPNVELANTLSRLMLGPASQSIALAQQNLMANMFAANAQSLLAAGGGGNFGLAGQYAGITNAAMIQGLLSTGGGMSLLSPAVQQQLLVNAGTLTSLGQTATHNSNTLSSGMNSTTTVSGSAPVTGFAAPAGGHTSAQSGSAGVPPSYGSTLHPNASYNRGHYPLPRDGGR